MSEMPKNKVDHIFENLENQYYKEFQAATEDEQIIMGEINKVFETTLNRKEAEKIVLETLAPKMDEAIKKSRQILDKWINEMKG